MGFLCCTQLMVGNAVDCKCLAFLSADSKARASAKSCQRKDLVLPAVFTEYLAPRLHRSAYHKAFCLMLNQTHSVLRDVAAQQYKLPQILHLSDIVN